MFHVNIWAPASRPRPGLEIWEPENLNFWKPNTSGTQKRILKIKICVANNVGKVWTGRIKRPYVVQFHAKMTTVRNKKATFRNVCVAAFLGGPIATISTHPGMTMHRKKKTFAAIITSCGKQATMLPDGLKIHALESLVLPSADVLEITQHLSWPGDSHVANNLRCVHVFGHWIFS